ncbi:unnamed protein product [Malus baccata var. baccata]
MDEIWERAVETALEGQTDHAAARALTLDGAVKCVQGRLPPPGLLEKFQNLQHLSIANVGVSSLEQFPRLRNLQKLILSDNRIAGGLEFLVEAGLNSLRDLDLSNNRIQQVEDLAPLAQLRLVSLDLYECPVTHVKDYRSRVFGLIKSLKYLDKMDADENERPESDDEEEDEEDEEDDPGSGEIDGEERPFEMTNGHSEAVEGVVDVDEDEESDADEEETVTAGRVNGANHPAENGFRFAAAGEDGDEDEEEPDEDDENDSGEEIDEDGEDDDVVEVHEIEDSDDEEDGVEYDEDDDDDDEDEDDEEEEVDNDEGDLAEPESTGRLTSTEGEIDGHEQGEDDDADEDDNGETGEEEQLVEEDVEFEDEDGDEEEEDYGGGYLVQPVAQAEEEDAGGSDMDPGNEEGDGEEEEVEDEEDDEVEVLPPSSSSQLKRKRDGDADSDDNGEDDEEDDDVVEYSKSSKKHPSTSLLPKPFHNFNARDTTTTTTRFVSPLKISAKAKESSDESSPTIAEIAAIAGGLISTPVIGWSLYTLKTTGCGLPPGPGGSIGALEGVSYLAVLGIVGWSLYTKTKTGSGLPNGPFGLLGAVEGLSFLSLLSILVTARNSSKVATDNQVPIFSSTQAKNFFSTVAARKVMRERQIIWDDLSLSYVICFDDLIEQYRLHRVNSLPPNYNISMVQEFYSNIPSNFLESGRVVYIRGVMVAFDPSIICTVLELDLSSASVSSKYNVATSQYDLSAYHREAYVSKSRLKPFYRIWSDFIRRNVLGMSNNAQGDRKPVPPPNASQDRKIAYLKSEINSLRKQFVDFKSLVRQSASSPLVSHSISTPSLSQTSLNPPSFVPEPSLHPPKLVPQRPMTLSHASYRIATSSSHSSVVAAKMAAIYATKGKGVTINVHHHVSSTFTSKGKHIRFSYSFDEDEDAEGFSSGPHWRCPY